jgi:hypothetical protein
MKQGTRETELCGSERHFNWKERKEFIIGFKGSQAVPVRPSGRVKALDRIIVV